MRKYLLFEAQKWPGSGVDSPACTAPLSGCPQYWRAARLSAWWWCSQCCCCSSLLSWRTLVPSMAEFCINYFTSFSRRNFKKKSLMRKSFFLYRFRFYLIACRTDYRRSNLRYLEIENIILRSTIIWLEYNILLSIVKKYYEKYVNQLLIEIH